MLPETARNIINAYNDDTHAPKFCIAMTGGYTVTNYASWNEAWRVVLIEGEGDDILEHIAPEHIVSIKPIHPPTDEDPIRLGSYLVKRGYNLVETGGNCRAWVRIMTNGEHVVVTDAQGIAEPDETDWMIGRYATEDWTDGYNAQPDEEGDKTLDGFIAALDRAEGNTLAALLAGEY